MVAAGAGRAKVDEGVSLLPSVGLRAVDSLYSQA